MAPIKRGEVWILNKKQTYGCSVLKRVDAATYSLLGTQLRISAALIRARALSRTKIRINTLINLHTVSFSALLLMQCLVGSMSEHARAQTAYRRTFKLVLRDFSMERNDVRERPSKSKAMQSKLAIPQFCGQTYPVVSVSRQLKVYHACDTRYNVSFDRFTSRNKRTLHRLRR